MGCFGRTSGWWVYRSSVFASSFTAIGPTGNRHLSADQRSCAPGDRITLENFTICYIESGLMTAPSRCTVLGRMGEMWKSRCQNGESGGIEPLRFIKIENENIKTTFWNLCFAAIFMR